jgi:ParB family chromosome partitioning protein
MRNVVTANPFRCRMWMLHDRIEGHVTERTCSAEIASFSKHGQLVPALGRPLRGDPDFDYELIYGARRLFVARHINKPLTVEVRELSDREAILAMDIENRQRVDVSAYERGVSYVRWLRAGHFDSQEDLARALKVSPSMISRVIKLAKLPAVVISAFSDPSEICERWGLELVEALEDPRRREPTLRAARHIAAEPQRLGAPEIHRRLLASAAPGRKLKQRVHDEVVKDDTGQPLFRIRQNSTSIALLLPIGAVSAGLLDEVRNAIRHILKTSELNAKNNGSLAITGRSAEPLFSSQCETVT